MTADPKAKEKDILNEMLVSIGGECDRVKTLSENLALAALVTAVISFFYGMYAQSYIFLLTFVGGGLWNWLYNVSSSHKQISDIIFKQFDCPTMILQKEGGADGWIYSVLNGKGGGYLKMTSELDYFYKHQLPKFFHCPFNLDIPTKWELRDAMNKAHPDGHILLI